MSDPCPPAFIRTAPPSEPGTPTAHSKPRHPAAARRRATTGRANPDPPRAHGASDSSGITSSPPRPVTTTAIPGNPSSATSRFDPRPTTSTGNSDAARAAATASRSSRLRARTSKAAAPPSRYVVNGASETSRSARSPSISTARSVRSARSRLTPTSASGGGRSPLRATWRCRHSPSRCTRRPSPTSPARNEMMSSRRGSQTTRAFGCASSTASTTKRPVTPGIGVVPDA